MRSEGILRRVVLLCLIAPWGLFADAGPLASWNEGAAKSAIIEFVLSAVDEDGEHYIPPEERIATFDQDGTLWVEHPLYTQFYFAIDNLKKMTVNHLPWKLADPFKILMGGDIKAISCMTIQYVEQLLTAAHAGLTVDEFHDRVADWLATAVHPVFQRPYTDLIYQPMLEVVQLLKEHRFKVYIVSGGGQEFIRVFAEEVYGIPPENVIGTAGKVKFEYADGEPVLRKQAALLFLDDKGGKPEGINLVIGRRPVAAFGNSDGDRQMLQWTYGSKRKTLQLLVHHDDATREFSYDGDTKIGTFSPSLMSEAIAKKWVVVSMKNDWKRVFSWQD